MNRANLKNWFEKSDWRIWLVLAIVIIIAVSLIQDIIHEHFFNKKRQKILSFIDGTENAIHQARNDAAKRDQEIDAEFNRVMQSSSKVISSGHEKMDSIRQKMNEE